VIDSKQRMPKREALAIVAELPKIVCSTRAERVMAAFEALVTLDAERIEGRAQEALDGLDPQALGADRLGAADLLQRATMRVFRGSLLAVLEETCPDLDPFHDGDIATWIAANARAVVQAHMRAMEASLPADDPHAQRNLSDFHRLLDRARCEAEQTEVLLQTWAGIAAQVRARLGLPAPAGRDPH
jgi:hypothetical protein